jgi:hypothetical protein
MNFMRSLSTSALLAAWASTPLWADTTLTSSTQELMQKIPGRYLQYDMVAYTGKTSLGEMRTLTVSYGLTDLALKNNQLEITTRLCFSEQKSNLPVKITIPDSFTQSIKPKPVFLTVKEDEKGVLFWRPESPTPVGIRLSDPNEPLPLNTTDPRISDDDADGKPGVTANIAMGPLKGQMYMIRREVYAYELRYFADGSLRGVIHDRSEEFTIGASNRLFNQQTHMKQHANLNLSPVFMRPTTQEMDCATLKAKRNELLPPAPEVWKD